MVSLPLSVMLDLLKGKLQGGVELFQKKDAINVGILFIRLNEPPFFLFHLL